MATIPVELPPAPTDEQGDLLDAAAVKAVVLGDDTPYEADAAGWFTEPVEVRVAGAHVRYQARKPGTSLVQRRHAHQGQTISVEHVDDLVRMIRNRSVVEPGDKVPGEFILTADPEPDPLAAAFDVVDDDDDDEDDLDDVSGKVPDLTSDPAIVTALSLDTADPVLVTKVRDENVQQIVTHAGDSGPVAQALLDIEHLVAAESGRDPRKTLVTDLQRIIRDADDDLTDDPADDAPPADDPA